MRTTHHLANGITTLVLIVALGACSGESGKTSAVEGTTTPSESEEAVAAADGIRGTELVQEPAPTAAPVPAEPAGAAEERAEPAAAVADPDAEATPTDPAEIVHPSELLAGGRRIPPYPMGEPEGESMLAAYFEEHPELKPDDPEADAVRRGRRLVGPVDRELDMAYDTPEQLAEAYLDAIFLESLDILDEIRVSKAEHAEIFWPEFPQSRPITNVAEGEAWFFHQGHCREGVMEALKRWGGKRLWLVGIRYEEGIARYRNFNLYHGVVIEAQADTGERVDIKLAPTFAERNGRWKVYIYHDD